MLTGRFEDALVFAARLHAGQKRKGTDIPYLGHLLGVASLVLEDGGDEDQAIAGLLHDAVEDQGGLSVLEVIRQRFGERVARIVDGCTDTYDNPKPAWRTRKEHYLAHLSVVASDVLRVSLADKLHNARAILHDLHRQGISTFDRFNGGREGTLWYYSALVIKFKELGVSTPMVDELEQVVNEILQLAAEA